MFGTMKKAMVIAAVAGLSAVAPAVASADTWTIDGVNPFAGTAHASGRLTLTVTANGAQTSCDVTASLDLDNGGTAPNEARGQVTSFLLGAPAGGNCTTTVPGCSVTAVASALPWSISTSGTSVTISGINFANTYTGSGCALAGVPVSASGSITGTASGDTITFVNGASTTLTSTFGPATVSGSVTVKDTSGNPVSLMP